MGVSAADVFRLGDMSPRRVERPESPEAAAAAILRARDNGEAIVIFGGGTLQALGALPLRYDVALSTERLGRTLAYDHRDLTVSVEAGMRVRDLERMLAEHGQFVPLDVPRKALATVGGSLASGWLSPRRGTYGRMRDLVIGSCAALEDGTLAHSGGMVVKNVTGYDMSKLYAGSLGTLGAIVSANFKTIPLPQAQRLAVAALPQGTRIRAIAHVEGLAVEPAAALAVDGFDDAIPGRVGAAGRLFVLIEGSATVVERATRELRSALGAAGVPETQLLDAQAADVFAQVIDAYVASRKERSVTYRQTGLPGELDGRERRMQTLAQAHELGCETIADIQTGDLIARISDASVERFAQKIGPFDDSLHPIFARSIVLAAPEALRGRLAMRGAPSAASATMRALQARFDGGGTFAPGRLFGAAGAL